MLSGRVFVRGCLIVALLLGAFGRVNPLPVWLLGAEVMATILGLFLFGSFKYQIHKNALTYGMLLVIVGTFSGLETSEWHVEIAERGWRTWGREHLLSFHGLDELLHADTMLFILGLTYFVSVIAQTRLLEGVTLRLVHRYKGAVLPTVIAVTAAVALASGVLDGVSMIGLTIRTLVIVLLLAAAPIAAMRYAVMVCTAVTTICGAWLAYGEPPNLIMKANLFPYLDNAFFLMYCAPAALASYLVIAWNLRGRLGGQRIDVDNMDVLDANAADVRFLQAERHGEVMTPVELVEGHAAMLQDRTHPLLDRLRGGEPLGLAMIRENVPQPDRRVLLGHYVSDELADGLDTHYIYDNEGLYEKALQAELAVDEVLAVMGKLRKRAQKIGALALIPFGALLIVHGIFHEVPLFLASFGGFLAALPAIWRMPRMRGLAFREAFQEYAEYYFLFPLFLSITLLTNAGFFDSLQALIKTGIEAMGRAHVAYVQFLGSTVLSAILDNNVVADFASRALHDLDLGTLHLFAAAQIAGYAVGGCWTHIGCAQSVVAFAFILRDIDEHYTPLQWIRDITPILLQIIAVITVIIYAESALVSWFAGR